MTDLVPGGTDRQALPAPAGRTLELRASLVQLRDRLRADFAPAARELAQLQASLAPAVKAAAEMQRFAQQAFESTQRRVAAGLGVDPSTPEGKRRVRAFFRWLGTGAAQRRIELTLIEVAQYSATPVAEVSLMTWSQILALHRAGRQVEDERRIRELRASRAAREVELRAILSAMAASLPAPAARPMLEVAAGAPGRRRDPDGRLDELVAFLLKQPECFGLLDKDLAARLEWSRSTLQGVIRRALALAEDAPGRRTVQAHVDERAKKADRSSGGGRGSADLGELSPRRQRRSGR